MPTIPKDSNVCSIFRTAAKEVNHGLANFGNVGNIRRHITIYEKMGTMNSPNENYEFYLFQLVTELVSSFILSLVP